jgi:redox-sensitive bicupin YhaK (pirin superfamily)
MARWSHDQRVSNLESSPTEIDVGLDRGSVVGGIEILQPREVPLGGPRAMLVRRTLPQRGRSLIGAWCFADHYGPHDLRQATGMDVPPHPHTGLQTVSWLFSGEIEHRDSAGVHAMVRPGELNLMTAGAGICHSEVSTAATTMLHGVQLWVALPDGDRDTARGFDHYVPTPVARGRSTIRVFLGTLDGVSAPVPTFTPLLGAQLDLAEQATLTLDVDPAFEHGVLVDRGEVAVDGAIVKAAELAYRAVGSSALELRNTGGRPARVLVLGGTPFAEELLMWWNFVGRSHEDIAAYREQWQDHDARFGEVVGYQPAAQGVPPLPHRLPAPPLPTTRLRPRPTPS